MMTQLQPQVPHPLCHDLPALLWIGDTLHMRLLDEHGCVFPHQRGIVFPLLTRGYVSLRNPWALAAEADRPKAPGAAGHPSPVLAGPTVSRRSG